ncbi:hypothetical protein ACWDYC_39030, partial [Streptomyces tendae]
VIRWSLAFPDSKVVAHARRLSCRSDSHKKRRQGVPSPSLLARADRGFARFLGQHDEDQVDGVGGGEDPQR